MEDTAARGNGMAIADSIAAKVNGTTVADGSADKGVGTDVVNGIAARANVPAVVDDAPGGISLVPDPTAGPDEIPVLVMEDTAARGNGMAIADSIAAKVNGTTVADGSADKGVGTDVVNGIAARANVPAVVDDAPETSGTSLVPDPTAGPDEILVLVMEDTAARGNGMAIADSIAAKVNGITEADGFADKGVGTDVVNGIAARANVPAVVHDAPKTSGTSLVPDPTAGPDEIPRCLNLLKYVQVGLFKAFMILRFSGVTELVNDSNVNIKFYAETMNVLRLRFCLNAHQTKHINMRKLSPFSGANAATVVILMVGGRPVELNFVPQHFIIYKKFKISQNEKGELVCPIADRVVRSPRRA